MTERSADSHDSEGERLFIEWLANQAELLDTGDRPAQPTLGPRATEVEGASALAALCAEHPEHAATLRALHADYSRIANVVYRSGRTLHVPALAERIRAQYGPGVDPRITLEPQGAETPPSDFSSEVLSRLSSRPDASGRYRIQGELDRGGQGAILRVWDEDLRRHLAMKVTLGRVSKSDTPPTPSKAGSARDTETPPVAARSVGRFLEEAQVTGQLDHPGIVPVHELGLDSLGRVFFTMKLVKGEDLKAVFARVHSGEPGWTVTRALSLLLKVCEAMSYAHSKRVIHRDLKPSNIMVGRYGEVFVMDWGLARVLDRKDDKDVRVRPPPAPLTSEVHTERRERAASDPESPLVTMDGDVVGTPAYMSPEQASGRLERMGPPSDVYALGAMLYHLLTRRMPYVAPDGRVNNYAILSRVQEGPPVSVASLAPDAPAELVAICEKAMARDAHDRYPDMLELAEDLRAFLENRVVAAYATGAVAELRKWVVRNKALAAALGAGVLLLAGGLTSSLVLGARAERNARLARANANDVMSLSTSRDIDEVDALADTLWPPYPDKIAAYCDWLTRAQALLDGEPSDGGDGSAGRPSLAEHRAKLAELQQRASPWTEAAHSADRASHPRLAELQCKRAELTWRARMLGLEPWPPEEEAAAALPDPSLSISAHNLNNLAWKIADPSMPAQGREVEAVLLARRAVASASADEAATVRETLVWALFRAGRFDEALGLAAELRDAAAPDQRVAYEDFVRTLDARVAEWRGAEALQARRAELEALRKQVAALEQIVQERCTWDFPSSRDAWWHVQLSSLIRQLEGLGNTESGLMADCAAPPFGWGIPRRLRFASEIEDRSLTGTEARARWAAAVKAIASSPRYDGLRVTPQLGLLPLGSDPDSGLWEFAHLSTGEPAERGPDERLRLKDEDGIVLVLIPGRRFWMGAQRTDPLGHNFDPQARNEELPVHEVVLSPYFISKYEMTQAQWLRLTGENPSFNPPRNRVGSDEPTLCNPVEQVSWHEASKVLQRADLVLPTEAQWECAARGGTETPWSTGRERETLVGAANLADQAAARAHAEFPELKEWPEFDDGWAVHARVGSFRANPFGLHDVHGNVWEWCLDSFDSTFYAKSPLHDPCSPWAGGTQECVGRGGCYTNGAKVVRSANRNYSMPHTQLNRMGVRPARELRSGG